MPVNDPSNPWSFNPWAPPTGPSAAEKVFKPKVPHAPKIVPGSDDLFQVQRNALKTLNGLDALEDEIGEHLRKSRGYQQLRRDAENTYRVIRSYLSEYLGG